MNLFHLILGPGSSGCEVYGNVTLVCENSTILPITSFPKECSSFFFNGLTVDMNYSIYFTDGDDDKSNKNILNIVYIKILYTMYYKI